jgi:hypothetical protein
MVCGEERAEVEICTPDGGNSGKLHDDDIRNF